MSSPSAASYSRRDVLRAGAAASIAVAGLPTLARGGQGNHPAMIDCLAIGGPDFDPGRARDAGLTALVLDLPIYPRTRPAAMDALGRWAAAFAAANTGFHAIRRGDDFRSAFEMGKLGVVLACQDAAILDAPSFSVGDTNLVNLRTMYGLGLRILQLAHNDRNGVADTYQEPVDAGLSRLGDAVVREMNQLRMMVDLSHCGDRTAHQAIQRSTRPCVVTHAGCRALYPTGRNKPDEVIRALADRGGLFAVYSMSLWLTDALTTSVDDVVRHLDHAVNIAGIEHVGFGSDGPPLGQPALNAELAGMRRYAETHLGQPGSERIPTHVRPRELAGLDRLGVLARALRAKGYATADVERIVGGNFVRVFREVCG